MDCDVWGLLHDGTIEAVSGSVPGDVTLSVDLECVCDHLPSASSWLLVNLHDCTHLGFRRHSDQTATSDLGAIAAMQLELLGAEMRGDFIEAHCESGTLIAKYAGADIQLAEGERLTVSELRRAAEKSVSDSRGEGRREQ